MPSTGTAYRQAGAGNKQRDEVLILNIDILDTGLMRRIKRRIFLLSIINTPSINNLSVNLLAGFV